jgi:hypothetical protein
MLSVKSALAIRVLVRFQTCTLQTTHPLLLTADFETEKKKHLLQGT